MKFSKQKALNVDNEDRYMWICMQVQQVVECCRDCTRCNLAFNSLSFKKKANKDLTIFHRLKCPLVYIEYSKDGAISYPKIARIFNKLNRNE